MKQLPALPQLCTLAVLIVLVARPATAATTRSVTAPPFNADPTGMADATAAINAAIAASSAGDTVYFPTGTYKLTISSTTVQGGPSLVLKSGISLQGNGLANSTLRLANGQHPYYGLIGGPAWRLSDVTMLDLTVDGNGPNNALTTDDTSSYPRVLFIAYAGSNLTLRRCGFTNVLGSWAVGLDGPSNCTIEHCQFTNVGGGSVEFDHSTIYTTGDNFTITNNVFSTRSGPGTKAGRTAIEIHGSYQTVANNSVSGYRYGVNACNNAPSGGNFQLYKNNTFTDIGTGIVVWTPNASLPFQNCTIDSNTFSIKVDAANWYDTGSGFSAVIWDLAAQAGAIEQFHFTNNTVTWSNASGITYSSDLKDNAIQLEDAGSAAPCTNLLIQNNRISGSLGAALFLTTPITGMTVTGNTITDAGSSPTLLDASIRSAMRVSNSVQNALVADNTFIDDRSTPRMAEGIWEGTNNLGNCAYGGNTVQFKSGQIPEFVSGSGHQGPPWTHLFVPTITTQPASQTVQSGQAVTFTVAVSGSTPLSYQWQEAAPGTSSFVNIAGATAASYTTAATSVADSGASFRVLASNSIGSATSATAKLIVLVEPPVITSAAAAAPNPATIGQPVSFSVAASDSNGDALTCFWDFGDGATGSGASTTHSYAAAGTFTAIATLSDAVSSMTSSVAVSVIQPNSGTAIQINSGGRDAGTFVADTHFSGGTTYSTTARINTSGVTNPAPQSVYQTERYGNFTYTIPGLTPGASYIVRLHFAEIYWDSAGQRRFNVSINGIQALTNFDVFAAAGGKYIAIVKEFAAKATDGGHIVIAYATLKDNAKSSGIEVLSTTPAAPKPVAASDAPDAGVSSINLGTVKPNQLFKIQLAAPETGASMKKLHWIAVGRLPKGMRLSRGGFITGRLKTAGVLSFKLQLKSKGGTGSNTYSLGVAP